MCDQQSLRSACAHAQSDQSLCLSLEYSISVKLVTEHHLEFIRLTGGASESIHECQNATLLKITCQGSFVFVLSILHNDYWPYCFLVINDLVTYSVYYVLISV